MPRISRREFVRLTALGLGVAAFEPLLSACSKAGGTPAPGATGQIFPSNQSLATATESLPAETEAEQAAESESEPTGQADDGNPYLVVVRQGEPEELVRRAIAALGGMGKFVPKGARVLIKPNICVAYHSYEYAATTNPWVVAALVRLAFEVGAKSVQVLDYPFGGSADEAYTRSGIEEQVRAAGGEMAPMPGFKFQAVDLPQAVDLRRTKVFKDALDADVLIDAPIAKHHGLARLTLGMKNLMGLVQDRGSIHHNLGQRIADLTSLFQPDLTVVDAVRVLMANGPTGGDLDDVKKLDTVIASADIVAADSYATSLFGLRPQDISYIQAAAAMGLGRSDLQNLKIEQLSIGG